MTIEREMIAYWRQQIDYHEERIKLLTANDCHHHFLGEKRETGQLQHALRVQSERKLREAWFILDAIEAFVEYEAFTAKKRG